MVGQINFDNTKRSFVRDMFIFLVQTVKGFALGVPACLPLPARLPLHCLLLIILTFEQKGTAVGPKQTRRPNQTLWRFICVISGASVTRRKYIAPSSSRIRSSSMAACIASSAPMLRLLSTSNGHNYIGHNYLWLLPTSICSHYCGLLVLLSVWHCGLTIVGAIVANHNCLSRCYWSYDCCHDCCK